MTETLTANGFKLDTGGKRVVVDPICRIEGHLRIEVNLDSDVCARSGRCTGHQDSRECQPHS
jgi:hydrogenase large subunit